MKWNVVIVIAAISFIVYEQIALNGYHQITGIEVDKWRNILEQSSFRGEVTAIEKKRNKSKHVQFIHLSISDTLNIKESANCEYFKIADGNIIIAAHNLNVNTGPKHRIIRGDILEKAPMSDSIFVYSKTGCYKYYFPLFDGLGSKGRVEMSLTSEVYCD